jgi:hypothetical protein
MIDSRLRKDPHPGLETLKEHLEEQFSLITAEKMLFSRITVKKDLKDMRKDFNAPISFSFHENHYFYLNKEYSFLNLPQSVLDRLIFALKLQYLCENRTSQDIQIQFEEIPTSEGYNYIPIIVEAICQKKALSVKYKAATSRRSSTLILHPQGVREHQGKFFLLAAKDKEREVRSYDTTYFLDQPIIMEKEALSVKDFKVVSFNIEDNN